MTFLWLVAAVVGSGSLAVACARLTRQYALSAIACAALILILHARVYLDYTPDDAYISYRYARHLADGVGPFWNPGEQVEGYSNFLWVVVLGGAAAGGLDIEFSAAWLGLALAVAGCAGTYQLTRALLPSETGRVCGLIAAIILPCSTAWALWSMSGLEGPLFAALILAAVLLQLRELQRPRATGLSGALWALACMTRLDGLVLFAVSVLFRCATTLMRLRKPVPGLAETNVYAAPTLRPGAATETKQLAVWASLFAVVFVPYFAWRWATYGWLLPNTYYAKVGSGIDQYERGIRYSIGFLNESGAWALCVVPVAVALTAIRPSATLYVLSLVVTWVAYISYVGGDFMLHYRLFAPVLPLAFAAIAAAVGALAASVRITGSRTYRLTLGAACAAALALIAVFLLQPSTDLAIDEERELDAVRNEQGRWLRDNVPATTSIAVYGAGAIPYQSRLPSIDILGLNDEHIAHRDLSIGNHKAGHEKYDSQYVLDRRPDVIILADFRTGAPWTRDHYEQLAGYTTIPGIADLIGNERLWRDYEPRAYPASNGLWFNMLVHRDARAVLAMTRAASR